MSGVDLKDEQLVAVSVPVGSLAALCVTLAKEQPCTCGDTACEVFGYALQIGKRALADALADAAEIDAETVRDVRAASTATLDQVRASLAERGLW